MSVQVKINLTEQKPMSVQFEINPRTIVICVDSNVQASFVNSPLMRAVAWHTAKEIAQALFVDVIDVESQDARLIRQMHESTGERSFLLHHTVTKQKESA